MQSKNRYDHPADMNMEMYTHVHKCKISNFISLDIHFLKQFDSKDAMLQYGMVKKLKDNAL